MKQRVLIAGCGDVGERLGRLLVADGHEVWALRRRTSALAPELRPIAADLTRPETLFDLPRDLDLVFYTAAADGFTEAEYEAAYVRGSANLLRVLESRKRRPRRAFFTSSTSVYAQSEGETVDEASPAEPTHFSGRRVRDGEERWLAGAIPATVVRFGGIYGRGRTAMLDALREGSATCVEAPPLWTNRIHVEDCAGALRHLAGLERPEDVYLAVDDEPAPLCEVLRWLAREAGTPAPRVVAERGAGERGLRSNKRCSNRRLRASGYGFRYPTFREGFRALLAEEAGSGA